MYYQGLFCTTWIQSLSWRYQYNIKLDMIQDTRICYSFFKNIIKINIFYIIDKLKISYWF